MKTKKRIIRVFSIFLLVICYYFSKSIYAVDLKFEANVNDSKALIRIFSKSFEESTSAWKYYSQNKTGNNGTYDTYGISFWGNKSSANYSLGYGNSTYDTYYGKIEATSDNPRDNLPSYSSVGRVSVSGNNSSHDLYFELPDNFNINTFTGDFYRYRSKDEKINSGYALAIQDFVITKNGLKKLTDLYYSNGNKSYVENGYLKIRFSLPQHTIWDHYRHLPNGYIANNAVHHTFYDSDGDFRQMMSHNYGFSGGNFVVGGSILNYYDNWLYIPLAKLNNRSIHINYWVKSEDGVWQLKKEERKRFGSEAQKIEKLSIDGKDSYYIGGEISQGATEEEAIRNLKNTTKNWGWNQKTIDIEASEDEQYYEVNLYYDYREATEKHLKVNGEAIDSTKNKTSIDFGPRGPNNEKYAATTKETLTFKAIIPFYHNYAKYVHVNTEYDGKISNDTIKIEPALNGANKLVKADKHDAKFYYEFEPPRQVFVRHFVYNEETKSYEIKANLTNLNAAIKDGEEGIYHLRKNGYNQRHYKCKPDVDYVDKIKAGFNEQYTIDFGDTIKLDKSRTLEDEGVRYIYEGYKMQNDIEPVKLQTKAQLTTLIDKTTTVEIGPQKVKTTYVDFYYTKTDIPAPGGDPDLDDDENSDYPTIDFVPRDGSGTDIGEDTAAIPGNCRVAYVPSGENLKSYITTNTYRPYSLIYDGAEIKEVDKKTGKITYKLKKYDAYRFVDGSLQNNSESKYGYINSTEKNGVFNTNSSIAITPNVSMINQVIIDSRNDVFGEDNINPNTITTVKDGRKTKQSDFGNENVHAVNYDKYNGVRNPAGTARYDVVSLVQDGNNVFKQKKMPEVVKSRNNAQVNVFTPITLKDIIVESENIVNHSNQDILVIQKNSEFKITPVTDKTKDYDNINDTSKYVKYYWFVTDFDIKLVNNQIVFDKNSNQIITMTAGQLVKAGNLIQIPRGGSFSAIATNDENAGDIINQFSNRLKIVAVTHNVTDTEFEKKIISEIVASTRYVGYIDNNELEQVETTQCEVESNKQTHKDLTDIGGAYVNNMYDDAKYFVEHTEASKNIGRVYDFKVTDCRDVNYKNVFRKSNNGDVNDLRGIKYFSGVRRLLVYGGEGVQLGANQNNQNNVFVERESTDSSINSIVTKTILPLGPYKHIDQNYVQAPKLGYRISFDLKTSGMYVKNTNNQSSQRYIRITPSYYYISKDGKTFKENIELYYKNSSGKYVNFVGSGYTIYFKPNDGYRTVYNTEAPELKDMSTRMEYLRIGDESFILRDSMMSYGDNNFVQAWYGEFKLPNSTIAVETGNNINNPLTNGYIGVRFDIKCIDKETPSADEEDVNKTTIISYNQNDKTAAEAGMQKNTSQWDYEGFLGFPKSNIGSDLDGELRIQLEKDFWKIDKDMYENIKGTVVLYDTDNRAANDFD